ncbi:uncharacterized protein LOC132734205 [Ruditapes philippinarum]|uniref:uncharacterized protein LOC132734205 n=1 Tax=Ruditapes philippinarum TaxID=129788 RepID=UPI00295AD8D9|nr:uncharacterized protein LOC132734205 [Ruditapes philippinarum]
MSVWYEMDDKQKTERKKKLYDILNHLGYSKVCCNQRIKIYDNASRCLERVSNRNWFVPVNVTVLGSRGEGMAVALGSDMDVLMLQPAVKCFETLSLTYKEENDRDVAIFELNFSDVPEGYAKLHLKTLKDASPYPYSRLVTRIKGALTSDGFLQNNQRIIESIENGGQTVRLEGWPTTHNMYGHINGPAQPLQYPLPCPEKYQQYLSIDYVAAFPCVYPSLLNDWFERVRGKSWPSLETSIKVKHSDLFVVPVGLAESDEEVLQWRISFTLAEILLVRSFHDAQIKAYALMKMILKHELKPICMNITSYQIKNVLFWTSEKRQNIQKIDFYELLLEVITFLKDCIEARQLQHYFIPSRNLMHVNISEEERSRLIAFLTKISWDPSYALQRCPLICNMCTLPTDEGLVFRNMVDELMAAFFAVAPEQFDEIEHLLQGAQSSKEYFDFFMKRVPAIVRKNNPYGYFHLILSKRDDDIDEILNEGCKKGYQELWIK